MMQSTSDASPASSSSSPSSSSRTPKRKPRPLHLRGTSTPTTGQSHLPAQPQVYGHELDGQEQVEDSRDEHDLHPATAGDHRQSRIMAHPPQQIYVLSADGSSLFLLDPTKPHGNEEPPPYMPFHDPAVETGIGETETPGLHIGGLHGHGHSMDPGGRETEAGREVGIGQNTNPAASLTQAPSRTNAGFDSGPSPRIGDRPPSTPRAAHVHRPLQIYRIDSNGALAQGGSSDIYAPTNTHYLDDPVQASSSRHRASTLSALQPRTRIPLSGVSGHRYSASIHGSIQTSTRPGYRTSTSYSSTTPVARSRDRRHARSAVSSPGNRTAQLLPDGTIDMDESTPLLGRAHTEIPGSGLWRSIFCGDLDVDTGETRQLSWGVGWKRFWRPIVRKEYWRAVLHLAVLNFPFVSAKSCLDRQTIFTDCLSCLLLMNTPRSVGFSRAQDQVDNKLELISGSPCMAFLARRNSCWYCPSHHSSDWSGGVVVDVVYRALSCQARGES